MNRLLTFSVLVVVAILLTSQYVSAVTFTQGDNEAKEEIISSLSDTVASQYSKYKTIIAETHDNKTFVIYNQSEPPIVIPPPDDNGTGQPPTCPPNQFYNASSKQCEDVPIIPPPPQPTNKPDPNFNKTTYLRTGSIADIDNNAGLVTQLNLMKKYNVQILIIPGDYGYNSCQGVIDKIKAAGFNRDNAVIIQGNHDCSSTTKAFNGWSQLYGNTNFPNVDGKLSVFVLDGNTGLSCTGTQFAAMKDKIESSDAWYNVVSIHQPFVTAESNHGDNNQFSCWDPLFRGNGVNPVLQGHNHNYQRFDINGIYYLTVGTGTHDLGSKLYDIGDISWNNFDCLKCIDDTNGITIIDFQIDNPHVKHMQGWFISNSDSVKDSFSK